MFLTVPFKKPNYILITSYYAVCQEKHFKA